MVGKGMLYKVQRHSRKVLCDQIFVLIKIIIIMVSFTTAVTVELLCENTNKEINSPMLMHVFLIYLCHTDRRHKEQQSNYAYIPLHTVH